MPKKTPTSPSRGPGTDVGRQMNRLRNQNENLKAQLMNTSLINELTKVMHSSTDPDRIVKTVLLGIQEIIEFDRVVLFEIDTREFCLKPKDWVGIDESSLADLTIPMGFEGGEITDAVFLNRHFLVDNPDPEADVFAERLDSKSYLVMPLISKMTRSCWDAKNCKKLSCPAHGSFNPYCWSIMGSGGDDASGLSENERRKRCIACPNFKAEGVFWMDRSVRKAKITSDHITTLSTILNQAGIIIENFRIFNALEIANDDLQDANKKLKVVNHDLRVAQSRINKDLEHARTIQQGLLPHDIEDTDEVSVGFKYIPAELVGGDYYDLFQIADGLFGIVVADVSGHGVASALIMSMVKVLLKTFADTKIGPQKTLERINRTFLSEIRTDNFVTVFYGVLDTGKNVLHYTSAGHCPALFFDKKSGAHSQVKADGLFLGVFPDMMLAESSFKYVPGRQRVILYTDGLTEAKNDAGDMFDLHRLEQAGLDTLALPPRKAMKRILDTQREFCGPNQEPADDITLLVIDI
ncbi:MAG: SpoIIE family protein phosphatase [Chitinivibrionales bacterium]|nr:SpoIIE family protein phosphatase [Chitinivibrionales bacterium]MBD3396383.1 SpoIIE family protein phosphatase [Chitinivibrionales bacterium]